MRRLPLNQLAHHSLVIDIHCRTARVEQTTQDESMAETTIALSATGKVHTRSSCAATYIDTGPYLTRVSLAWEVEAVLPPPSTDLTVRPARNSSRSA